MNTNKKDIMKTEKRSNRFTGQSIMLTKEEANKHDAIFINELAATLEDKERDDVGISKLCAPRASRSPLRGSRFVYPGPRIKVGPRLDLVLETFGPTHPL